MKGVQRYLMVPAVALVSAINLSGQPANPPARPIANPLSSVKSTAEVRQLIQLGISTNELVSKIGPPSDELPFPSGELLWRYPLPQFPADDDMRGTYVTSLSVWVAQSRVKRVSFGYTGGETKTTWREQIPALATTNAPVTLDFFVVRTNAHPGARFIDIKRLPKLGYIALNPDLTVRKLEDLGLNEQVHTDSEGKQKTNTAFSVALTAEDTRRFAELTRTNLDHKLLITIAKEPIIAPMIREPIESPRFLIPVGDAEREFVKTNLAKIKQ